MGHKRAWKATAKAQSYLISLISKVTIMPRKKAVVVAAPKKTALPELMRLYAVKAAREIQIKGEIEEKVADVKAGFQTEIQELQDEKNAIFKQLEAYARDNPTDFQEIRSVKTAHGKFGFHLGNPKVQMARGIPSKAVGILTQLGFKRFLRSKQEVDKEAILSAYASQAKPDIAAIQSIEAVGIRVVQEDTFYVQPIEAVVSTE